MVRPYSSSLTDREWEIIEPLLPKKKRTRPPSWTKRQILDGILYQLKNGCNWRDMPRDLPPFSTVYRYYKEWKDNGSFIEIMNALHLMVREQVKKNKVDNFNNHRLPSDQKHL
jgi:transposase